MRYREVMEELNARIPELLERWNLNSHQIKIDLRDPNHFGFWIDVKTGEQGDILDLWMHVNKCGLHEAMMQIRDYLQT